MTPQERQLVDDLFGRLSKVEAAPRDPDATAAISEGLRTAPNAVYALVQTVLIQDEALKRANTRIQELEGGAPEQTDPGFLDSMRDAIFGQTPPRGSVPNVRAPEPNGRPAWNTGQVMQQRQPQEQYDRGSYNQPYGAPQARMGGGGSFLGTAAAAAAGMVGGSLLLGSIRSMMGGSHQSFGDAGGLGGSGGESRSPWSSDQSSSGLARDAGVNDIGSSGQSSGSRAGQFDQAQADASQDADQDQDDEQDVADMDSDDFDGDSDSA